MNKWKLSVRGGLFDFEGDIFEFMNNFRMENMNNRNLVDITHGDVLHINILAPGVEKEDIEINVYKSAITVECKKETVFVPQFNHGFEIRGYDPDTIQSELKNGILKITLKKKEETKPKKVLVK